MFGLYNPARMHHRMLMQHGTLVLSRAVFLSGSYHILFVIRFEDDVRWILKVPAAAHPACWNKLAAQTLETEALTMRLIRRETSVPVPEVYAYETSPEENELRCAFILMEYVVGAPVYQVWFDASARPKTVESRRRRCLQDLANAIVQLNRFQFSRAGSPVFSEDGGSIVEIGPARRRIGQDEDKICEWGPWADAASYLRRSLDHDPPDDVFSRGSYKLLHLFFDWLVASTSSTSSSPSQTFVLSHPDFNPQNILMSEVDGSLQAMIDWDGTESVPRILGNEGYPNWLTRDWDPAVYFYGREVNGKIPLEDSPSELARIAIFMSNALSEPARRTASPGPMILLQRQTSPH